MQPADQQILAHAVQQLESGSLAARMSQLLGIPIEKAMSALPGHWSTIVSRITRTALEKALEGALYSMDNRNRLPSNRMHKLLAGVSGAVGGSFGITALAVELPISATIMLRSIADIARHHGEDLDLLDSKAACLTVFALSGGGRSSGQESANSSYYAVRSFLSKALGDTTNHIAIHGLSKEGAPALVKLLNLVATRFSIPVSEKLAAQSMPAIGAVGGASVNLMFIDHYQKMADAHFTVRYLEKKYGQEAVQQQYMEIAVVSVS